MKAYTFKNGNVVIKHNLNGQTVYTALLCNENDEQIEAVENLHTYAEARDIALATAK